MSPSEDGGVAEDGGLALARAVGERLRASGMTLGAAESCTGGLFSSLITDVPGSSDYFLGGIVSYAYEVKEAVLGVRHETLLAFGAVSAETASEMAQGARRVLGVDIAVAITGIAGPGGGTATKPVGLVHMHLSAPGAEWGEHAVWAEDRIGNKRLSAEGALRLVLKYLTTTAQS